MLPIVHVASVLPGQERNNKAFEAPQETTRYPPFHPEVHGLPESTPKIFFLILGPLGWLHILFSLILKPVWIAMGIFPTPGDICRCLRTLMEHKKMLVSLLQCHTSVRNKQQNFYKTLESSRALSFVIEWNLQYFSPW